MTDLATLPTVPPIVGGIFKNRSGGETGLISQGWQSFTDGHTHWHADGRHFSIEYEDLPQLDLIELLAVAVPVAELAQLRRAEALCRAAHIDETCYGSGSQQEHVAWLAYHAKGTPTP